MWAGLRVICFSVQGEGGVYIVEAIEAIEWCREDNCPEQPLHHVPAAPTDFVIRREERSGQTGVLLLQILRY